MKKLFLFFALALMCGAQSLLAQAPREMTYQLMVIDPDNGRIRADKDVAVRMEIRRGDAAGNVVWAQDFAVHTDKAGLCTLTLSLSDGIDWADGEYYLAAIIDGEEGGAARITSVPYALHAAEAGHAVRADSLSGIVSREELVGTWMWKLPNNTLYASYVLNEDGTGTYTDNYGMSVNVNTLRWQFFSNGFLHVELPAFTENDPNRDKMIPVVNMGNGNVFFFDRESYLGNGYQRYYKQ